MAKKTSHNTIILFEEFIEFLRYNGFSVGVDTHLRVNRVLESLDESFPAEKLKTILAPVMAHSPQQQEEFYRLFDSYFARYLLQPVQQKNAPANETDAKPAAAKIPTQTGDAQHPFQTQVLSDCAVFTDFGDWISGQTGN